MARVLPFPVTLAVLTTIIAGCMATPPDLDAASGATSIEVPAPRIGDRFVYEGSGGRLTVEVAATTTRVDAFLRPHDVVLLDWRLVPSWNEHQTFQLQEAVDPVTGLTVQQVARCGMPLRDDPDTRCFDDRALVLLSAAGLPGAFGAGPAWTPANLSEGPLNVPVQPVLWNASQVSYRAALIDVDGSRCLELTLDDGPGLRYRGLPYGVVDGPFVVCEGLPLPASFTDQTPDGGRAHWHGPQTWTLVNHTRGTGPVVQTASAPGWSGESRAVPTRRWQSPLLVADPTEDSTIPVPRAHREALNRSERYADMFAEEPPPLLAATVYNYGTTEGSVAAGTVTTRTDERSLVLVAQDGRTVRVVVSRDSLTLGDMESYSVEEEDTDQVPDPPTPATVHPEQAETGTALTLGRNLIGTDVVPCCGYGKIPQIRGHPWGRGIGDSTPRSDGYTFFGLFDAPSEDVGAGLNRITPHHFMVDGPTGALLWLTLPRDRLPIEDHLPS